MNETKATNLRELASHGPCVIVEFRGQNPRYQEWADKEKAGQKKGMHVNTIAAEMAGPNSTQITLDLMAPKGANEQQIAEFLKGLPFKKGDLCVVTLRGYTADWKATTGLVESIVPFYTGEPLTVTKPAPGPAK